MKPLSLLLLCVCLSIPAPGQKQPTKSPPLTAHKLIALKVTGTTRYTDKEILAASGLQIGQNVAEGDFKEAVRRIGDSGLFTDIAYSYFSSAAGTKLELQLTDIDPSKLAPAQFENFVWFTDEQLRAALQQRVPLFTPMLPLAGNLQDRVTEALQDLLAEKQIAGHVSCLRNADAATGALNAIDYRVEDVSIEIRSLEFPGASPDQAALLAKAGRSAIASQYSRLALAAVAKFDLLPVYLQRGYLKAEFRQADARIVPKSVPDAGAQTADFEVDAIVPVTPGKVYSVSGVTWQGTSAIATSEIVPLVHLPLGQPADAVRLPLDLEKVTRLYRSRGYIMVQIKSTAQLDDDKSTVHYDLSVSEGDLYKMGELEITGLDTQAAARMRAAWTLHQGQPYNADYPNKFIEDTRQFLPRGLPWGAVIHETPDKSDKTVDIEIHFQQR